MAYAPLVSSLPINILDLPPNAMKHKKKSKYIFDRFNWNALSQILLILHYKTTSHILLMLPANAFNV